MRDEEKAKQYEYDNFNVGEEHGYLYTHVGDVETAFLDGAEYKLNQVIKWMQDHREKHRFLWSDIEVFKKEINGYE